MKNPPEILVNLSFRGANADEIVAAHPTVVDAIRKLASSMPDATFVAYVTPRLLLEPLEWSLVISSPTGKRTYDVSQRALGPPLLDNKKF